MPATVNVADLTNIWLSIWDSDTAIEAIIPLTFKSSSKENTAPEDKSEYIPHPIISK